MNAPKNTAIERLLLLGFGLTLGVLLLVGGIAWNIALPMNPLKSVDHTRAALSALDKLSSNLERAESVQWGYFLSHDVSLLEQRDTALGDVKSVFEELDALTLDSSQQQARLALLQAMVGQRIRLLLAAQMAFDAQGTKAVLPLFGVGRDAMAAVNRSLQQVRQDELTLLVVRKSAELTSLKVIVGSITLLLVVLVLLFVRIRGQVRLRMADEQTAQATREALLREDALQSAIFNSANFSSIATDAKGVIQIFNVGAERMLGYSAAEVMDKITPADISDPLEVVARAAALSTELDTRIAPGFDALVFKATRGIEDIYELTYIRKDGSRFPAVVSVTALRDAQEAIIGYLLIGTDNTVRKQIEDERAKLDQRLRDQQFYTRSLIESNIDAIMTTDPQGAITDANKQLEALTGCTRDELIGAPFKKFFTDQERAGAGVTRVLREGKLTNYELTAQARDGTQTVVSFNAATFHDRDRKLQGVFAAARDITERKQFELALQDKNLEFERASAAAEKANLAKSEFLSRMSHELRTPLNAVLGFAQLMASETPAPSVTQQKSIDHILQAGWYLLRLINEILDLAMVESGRVTLTLEPVPLTGLLQDCQGMIAPQAQQRGIEMSFLGMNLDLYVQGDHTRVKQVLINLLGNAIKYNRNGGSVVVRCALAGKNRVRISVSDTGAGLALQQIEDLFQPFNRLGQENQGEEGTGIGLVVTKQLVELMGGSIGVSSDVGVGSTFWVELDAVSAPTMPLDRNGEPDPAPQERFAQAGQSMQRTLLYVEDNPANLALVEQLIARRSDLKLLTAIDGHLGILLARTCQPDLILMDINLPGINGFGVLKILQDDPATAHIPVMALSANVVPRDIEKGLKAGFFRYLTKPIKVPEFMDALDVGLHFAASNKPATPAAHD